MMNKQAQIDENNAQNGYADTNGYDKSQAPPAKRPRFNETMAPLPARPFKKARYSWQIKNYEYTISKMLQNIATEDCDEIYCQAQNMPCGVEDAGAFNPSSSYARYLHNRRMLFYQAHAIPYENASINDLHQSRMAMLSHISAQNFAQLQSANVHFSTEQSLRMMPWTNPEMCKNLMGHNMVAKMLENMMNPNVNTQQRLNVIDDEDEDTEDKHLKAQLYYNVMNTMNNTYPQEDSHTSDDCETSCEDSDAPSEEAYNERLHCEHNENIHCDNDEMHCDYAHHRDQIHFDHNEQLNCDRERINDALLCERSENNCNGLVCEANPVNPYIAHLQTMRSPHTGSVLNQNIARDEDYDNLDASRNMDDDSEKHSDDNCQNNRQLYCDLKCNYVTTYGSPESKKSDDEKSEESKSSRPETKEEFCIKNRMSLQINTDFGYQKA